MPKVRCNVALMKLQLAPLSSINFKFFPNTQPLTPTKLYLQAEELEKLPKLSFLVVVEVDCVIVYLLVLFLC